MCLNDDNIFFIDCTVTLGLSVKVLTWKTKKFRSDESDTNDLHFTAHLVD